MFFRKMSDKNYNSNRINTENRSHPRGFTLVEILIVVIILGILASIIIPRFSTATEQTRDSMLKENLRNIRTQIAIYSIQHKDDSPGGDESGNYSEELLVSHMTGFSDIDGNTNDTRTEQYCFGPYLSKIPANPITEKTSIAIADEVPDTCTGDDGWIYIPNSNVFIADIPGEDGSGRAYIDY